MRLVLIRHGEAQTALDQLVGCHTGCTGLSERGRRQAELLRDRLARTGELDDATVLYSSILPRAIETAEIISPALGSPEVQRTCDLCEQHAGEADGLSWDEANEKYWNVAGWHSGAESWTAAFHPLAPGGESVSQFVSRAATALHDLARQHRDETVVVACHGGVIRASFVAFTPVALSFLTHLHVENTAISEWTYDAGTGTGTDVDNRTGSGAWRLTRHNDHAHLLPS